ncbi:TPA: hypothetical protein JZF81_004116 [Escherichia coli]|nr:hypothetical protein [Escherichia coli]
MKIIYIFLLLLPVICYASLPTRGVDVEVNKNVEYSTQNTTDEWLTVAEYSLVDLPQSTYCLYKMCNGANQSLTLDVPKNNKPYAKSTFHNFARADSPMEINTPDGVLLIRLTFSGEVNLGAHLQNNENNRVWTERVVIDNNAATTSIQISPDNPCGAFIGACSFTTVHGIALTGGGGKVKVEVKLPPALSGKEYTIDGLALAKIETVFNKTNTPISANYTNSYFVLSGKIKVPERCYLMVDGHNNGLITFNDVDASSGSNNIPLQTRRVSLKSTCTGIVGAAKPVISEVKLAPVGNTSFSDGVFKLNSDTEITRTSGRYLGIIANYLPDITSCSTNTGFTFVSNEYLNKKVVVPAYNTLNSDISSTSFISFGLCALGSGNDLLLPGNYSGAIQLTTRWRFSDD